MLNEGVTEHRDSWNLLKGPSRLHLLTRSLIRKPQASPGLKYCISTKTGRLSEIQALHR